MAVLGIAENIRTVIPRDFDRNMCVEIGGTRKRVRPRPEKRLLITLSITWIWSRVFPKKHVFIRDSIGLWRSVSDNERKSAFIAVLRSRQIHNSDRYKSNYAYVHANGETKTIFYFPLGNRTFFFFFLFVSDCTSVVRQRDCPLKVTKLHGISKRKKMRACRQSMSARENNVKSASIRLLFIANVFGAE